MGKEKAEKRVGVGFEGVDELLGVVENGVFVEMQGEGVSMEWVMGGVWGGNEEFGRDRGEGGGGCGGKGKDGDNESGRE
uniref:hypothetical protein n=1 Tax=Neisseria sicca TaxID=490 RepID=UPI001C99B8D8